MTLPGMLREHRLRQCVQCAVQSSHFVGLKGGQTLWAIRSLGFLRRDITKYVEHGDTV